MSSNTFWPKDTDNCFYLCDGESASRIFELAQAKWGVDVDFEITAEYIHTNCLTYDLHDPSDWQNFLCITRIKN